MTVLTTVAASGPYIPNGSTKSFPFSFKAMSAAEVMVVRRSSAGIDTPVTGFTVALSSPAGGTVTFGTAPVAGDPLYVLSDPDFTQQVNLANQGAFQPAALNNVFDRDAVRDIFLKEVANHAIAMATTNQAEILAMLAAGVTVNNSLNAASRSILASLSTALPAWLTEPGREGLFVWDGSNLSGAVASDPLQGIYVAPAADTSGATGAWVRRFEKKLNVRWFGAKGDNSTNDGPAFLAALALNEAMGISGFGYGRGTPGVFVPPGRYFLSTTTLEITATTVLQGCGVGEAGGGSSILRWSANTTGIRVQAYNTTGATATLSTPNAYGGDASIIQGLFLVGAYTTTDGDYHAIQLRARASIRDCYFTLWQGEGIYIKCNAGAIDGTNGNANSWEATKCIFTLCRNAMWVGIADANAGCGVGLSALSCRLAGFDDQTFLGCTWIACHTSGCGSYPYRTSNNNAQSGFLLCYAESDQVASSFASATIVLGGQLASTVVGTGTYIHSNAKGARIERDLTIKKTVVDDTLGNANLYLDSFSDTATVMFRKQETTDTGFIQMIRGTAMLLASMNVDEPIRLRPGNVDSLIADKTGALLPPGKSLMGSDGGAPTTGTWARGQMIFNATPSAGGNVGWVCVVAGTPGTWKTFGAIAA